MQPRLTRPGHFLPSHTLQARVLLGRMLLGRILLDRMVMGRELIRRVHLEPVLIGHAGFDLIIMARATFNSLYESDLC